MENNQDFSYNYIKELKQNIPTGLSNILFLEKNTGLITGYHQHIHYISSCPGDYMSQWLYTDIYNEQANP